MRSTSGGTPPIGFLASSHANAGRADRSALDPARWERGSRVIDSASQSGTPTDIALYRWSRYEVRPRLVGLLGSGLWAFLHLCPATAFSTRYSLASGLQRPPQDATYRISSLLQATLPAQNRRPKIAGPLNAPAIFLHLAGRFCLTDVNPRSTISYDERLLHSSGR